MLSFGTTYPNLKTLVNFENLIEIKNQSKNQILIFKFTNIDEVEQFQKIFISSLNDEINDYGIILTDLNQKNKVYYLKIWEILSVDNENVTTSSFILMPNNKIFKIWKEYFENGISEYNQWKKIKQSEKQAWLELALSFQSIDYEKLKSIIEIDGIYINSLNDFFCSIGEALNGKGGYFGKDLYGFYDCLSNPEFGTQNLKTVIWNNHNKSKWKLKNKFSIILETFKEFNIDVQLR